MTTFEAWTVFLKKFYLMPALYHQETDGFGNIRMGIKRINLDSGEIEILNEDKYVQYSIIGEKIVLCPIKILHITKQKIL